MALAATLKTQTISHGLTHTQHASLRSHSLIWVYKVYTIIQKRGVIPVMYQDEQLSAQQAHVCRKEGWREDTD